jgi:hypothetical protein
MAFGGGPIHWTLPVNRDSFTESVTGPSARLNNFP